MKFSSFLILTLLFGCQSTVTVNLTERTEAAFITDNSRIADGCEDFVRLANDRSDTTGIASWRKPTASSLPLYYKAISDIPPLPNSVERAVLIRYVETGKQVELLCIWGSRPKVKEIDILAISRR
ncbi:hypothetical protein [Spirosoma sp.]|uniref:hypothetical protein n=1 Tax=Spirosoma sp. TaxID=1899569 RepID=UPI0026156402|nr:hypothetical protein [Spirosoma sp.]MCX6215238.1 hypothetical protein [Spirosoma sp.]